MSNERLFGWCLGTKSVCHKPPGQAGSGGEVRSSCLVRGVDEITMVILSWRKPAGLGQGFTLLGQEDGAVGQRKEGTLGTAGL